MDARDYVHMRSEKRQRDGLEGLPGRQQKIGSFERFTKVGMIELASLMLLKCRMCLWKCASVVVCLGSRSACDGETGMEGWRGSREQSAWHLRGFRE